jgi:hypothetical protein
MKVFRFYGSRILLLTLAGLTGCLITPPIRTTTAIKTKAGDKQTIPKLAPVVGVSTREQVNEQYHAFAVNSGMPNVFLGQFNKSSWAMTAGVLYAGGFDGRMWNENSILATFDERGVVKTFEILPNKKVFARFVQMQQVGMFPRLDLSQPVPLTGSMIGIESDNLVTMELSTAGLTIGRNSAGPEVPLPISISSRQPFFIPIANLTSVHAIKGGVQFDLPEETVYGKQINFYAPIGEVLTFVRWYEQEKNVK